MSSHASKPMSLATVIYLLFIISLAGSEDDTSLLRRRKRYVVFPEGSSFSIALCMTVHTLTPDNVFTEGLNWGISYDLPNESKPELAPFLQLRKDKIKAEKYKYDKKKKYSYEANVNNKLNGLYYDNADWNKDGKYLMPGAKDYYKADHHYLQRRYRRDLYSKLEVIINAMGFNGRSCILRALCEAGQRFMPKGQTLVEEMIRIVFSLPLKKVFSFEPDEHRTYTNAHKAGHEAQDCLAMFPECNFSLIDMALGKYNEQNDDYIDSPGATVDDLQTSGSFDSLPPDLRYTMK